VDTLRARERASELCRTACQGRGLQLLDQTVALEHLAVARDPHGRLRLQRRYRFEFTEDGATRRTRAAHRPTSATKHVTSLRSADAWR